MLLALFGLLIFDVSAQDLKKAARENAKLEKTLSWEFGGKKQRGWQLYVLLIQQTIETKNNPDSSKFASAISDWQEENDLTQNGLLDKETLLALIKFWQSRRLNSSIYPAPDQLISTPIANFYDPTRNIDLLNVERDTFTAYKKMIAAAIAEKSLQLKLTEAKELAPEEQFLKIISAFRSREYQEQLRKKSPNSGSAGLAKNSPHFTGRALDIYVGGEPVTTKDANRAIQVETQVYKWLIKNAHRFGFYPYFYEPWHWEYVGK